VKALAPKHPEWKTKQPFKGIIENDMKAVAAAGEKGVAEVLAVTHAGMTTDEFAQTVKDWLAQTKHPRFKRPYTDLVYQPMLELLTYLRANGFKTFIVSGGGADFMRVFTEQVYGIPPEQVVGRGDERSTINHSTSNRKEKHHAKSPQDRAMARHSADHPCTRRG
jgi:phosphoglycolate phosphatase-like HAD superfamily hydrolase